MKHSTGLVTTIHIPDSFYIATVPCDTGAGCFQFSITTIKHTITIQDRIVTPTRRTTLKIQIRTGGSGNRSGWKDFRGTAAFPVELFTRPVTSLHVTYAIGSTFLLRRVLAALS
mmetsp:Transcript_9807/g.9902  ORF Transcript_9807/g.9902 Transcript_9807/m.9902 type:complete len:114 (-) Transcript_9807:303-644(-)